MPRRPVPWDLKRARAGSAITVRDWRRLCEAFAYCCAYCGEKPDLLTMDHVEPMLRGGTDTADNIVPACQTCNSSKGDLLLLEWTMVREWWWERIGRGSTFRNIRFRPDFDELHERVRRFCAERARKTDDTEAA